MRMSEIFGRRLRQTPAGRDPSTAYAIRAALVRFIEARVILLPLGLRVANNLSKALGQEFSPHNHMGLPSDVGFEEWSRLLDDEIQSYRQLPRRLFARREMRFSDDPKGLVRPSWVHGLQWQFAVHAETSLIEMRTNWLQRMEGQLRALGLDLQRLERDGRPVGWAIVCDFGPEKLLVCSACSYAALHATAAFTRSRSGQETPRPLEMVSTPGTDTIESLAAFLDIPTTKTLKAVFLRSDTGVVILALIRGDLDISLEKLERALGRGALVPASHSEIEAVGAVPGYASPIGLQVRDRTQSEGVLVVADPSIEVDGNFASGANKADFHYIGVNYPRDFEVTLLADIAAAKAGDRCAQCDATLESKSGIRVGDWETHAGAFRFSDESGAFVPGWLGVGTVYLEPVLAALIDVYHQDGVLRWPSCLAPYDVHLVDLRSPQATQEVLESLQAKGLSVLLDDRDASPGVKFTDADLLGCFLRITVSERNLDRGGLEIVCRTTRTQMILPITEVAAKAAAMKRQFM